MNHLGPGDVYLSRHSSSDFHAKQKRLLECDHSFAAVAGSLSETLTKHETVLAILALLTLLL